MIAPALLLSAALFAIGAYGVLARRNLLLILMSAELMLNGVNVALLAFARLHADKPSGGAGHVLVLMVMAVAAAEVAVGLAIVIAVFRNRRTVDAGDLRTMKG